MKPLARIGKILGPKGMMPNPKVGTLTTDVAGALAAMRRGRVEFRVDKGAIVHAPLGKASFDVDALYANAGALALALLEAKPKVLRGTGLAGYVLRVHLAPTMGASVEVSPSSLVAALEARRAAAAAEQQAGDGGA